MTKSATLICLLIGCFCLPVHGQYDKYFFNPDPTHYVIDSLSYDSKTEIINGDTLFVMRCYPEAKPKATVFFYPDFYGNLSTWKKKTVMRVLTGAGFQVVAFDYPGFGRSKGQPSILQVYNDAIYLFRMWVDDDHVKGAPVLLYGQGLGCQIAASLASIFDGQARTLVLDGCSPSYTDLIDVYVPKDARESVLKFAKFPYSVKASLEDMHQTKVLFIHSKEDPFPYKDVKRLYDKTKTEKEFWTYKGEHLNAYMLHTEDFVHYMDNVSIW